MLFPSPFQNLIFFPNRLDKIGGIQNFIHPCLNPEVGNLEVLVTTNAYCDKAWLHKPAETELLNLTSKILMDPSTNLKSIQLAFKGRQNIEFVPLT